MYTWHGHGFIECVTASARQSAVIVVKVIKHVSPFPSYSGDLKRHNESTLHEKTVLLEKL